MRVQGHEVNIAGVQCNYAKYNTIKFITHKNFQLSNVQNFIHTKIFIYTVVARTSVIKLAMTGA